MSSKKTDKLIEDLHEAIRKSDVAGVKRILKDNAGLSHEMCVKEFPKAGTALHAACVRGNADVVKIIVELSGIDVNVKSVEGDLGVLGKTPLHEACAYGHEGIVELLLSKGANPNAVEACGLAPLHSACQGQSVKVIQALLRAGANPDMKDSKQETPLQASILRSSIEAAQCLIESGCDVNSLDQEGQTALHYAAEWGHEALIVLLLSKGACVNQQDHEGRTPTHVTDESDIRDLLVKHGADTSMRDKRGRPAIESQLDMEREEYQQIDHCLKKHRLLAEKREIKCNAEAAEAVQKKINQLVVAGDSDVISARGNVMAELLSKRNKTGE